MTSNKITKDQADFLTGRVNVFGQANTSVEKELQVKSLRAGRMESIYQSQILRKALGKSYNAAAVDGFVARTQRKYTRIAG